MADHPTAPAGLPAELAQIASQPSFALIRRQDSPEVEVLIGATTVVEKLADIPIREGRAGGDDVLAVVPFRTVTELGYEVHDDKAPLVCLVVDSTATLPVTAFTDLPEDPGLDMADARYDRSDEEYAALVERIVREEIGGGEGANFVIRRMLQGQVTGWTPERAVAIFANLLRQEKGAYWTFLVQTGDRILVGASPERHLSCHDGLVTMNPISGTFRMASASDQPFEERFEAFLSDEKEILELMMVVDEELKMMAGMCPEGGTVIGPLLKPMTHLVHTEYELTGRSTLDVRDLLQQSMFAATVVGSPVENACRIIKQYEDSGRGYYGAVLARIGHDEGGGVTLDAPILIRTADIAADGKARMSVGATLVRDSVPASEVAETKAKLGGLLSALGLQERRPAAEGVDLEAMMPRFTALLEQRNARLSPFWLNKSTGSVEPDPALVGKSVLVVAAEDNFVTMLAHLLRSLGLEVEIATWMEVSPLDLDSYDIVLMGPGPGDPRRTEDARIGHLRSLTAAQLSRGAPLLAVCLGHQMLCAELGLELGPKKMVVQGAQERVDVFGREALVGFYNTFCAYEAELPGVETSARAGEIHAVRGDGFVGLQFHAESVLTPDGRQILADALRDLVGADAVQRGTKTPRFEA